MATKRKYAEQLVSMLYPNPTADKKLHMQEAMTVISQVRDYLMRIHILQNKQITNSILGSWLSVFENVEVSYDISRKYWYSYLPTGVVGLPNDMGVYQVYLADSPLDTFIPLESGFRALTKNQLVDGVSGKYSYTLVGDKIIYTQDLSEDSCIDMQLVSSSEDLGEYDEFPITSDLVGEMLDIAYQRMSGQKNTPEDLSNDNTSQ